MRRYSTILNEVETLRKFGALTKEVFDARVVEAAKTPEVLETPFIIEALAILDPSPPTLAL